MLHVPPLGWGVPLTPYTQVLSGLRLSPLLDAERRQHSHKEALRLFNGLYSYTHPFPLFGAGTSTLSEGRNFFGSYLKDTLHTIWARMSCQCKEDLASTPGRYRLCTVLGR